MAGNTSPLRSGDIVRIRDEKWRIVRLLRYGDASLADASGCDVTNRASHARFLVPFEAIDRFDPSAAPRLVRPRRWRPVARRVLADATSSWASLRAYMRVLQLPVGLLMNFNCAVLRTSIRRLAI
ncbi:MAG: hypothetical protein EXQ53_06070 [Acidobacteria bacterium]|nr:hypothetical protein [Acidobacteriota bacterium]